MNTERIRQALEDAGTTVSDGQWAELVANGRVEDVDVGAATVADLAKAVRMQRDIWRGKPATGVPGGGDWADISASVANDEHTRAIEVIAHQAAGGWEEVARARSTYLGGVPLGSLAEAQSWLEARFPEELSSPHIERITYLRQVAWKDDQTDLRWAARAQPVPDDHQLAELARLASRLSDAYSWSPAGATTFLLTDQVPAVNRLSLFRSLKPGVGPAFERLTLTVDPTVDPAKVAAAYRAWRREYWRGKHYKPLSAKHCRLAAFWATCNDEEANASAMRRWNDENGDEFGRYDNPRNFARDGRVALQRLLTPDLKPRSRHDGGTR